MVANPYLDFFLALPASCRRTPGAVWIEDEPRDPAWLAWKAAVAGTFAWAVPTDAAVMAIARNARRVAEIGCGSGYWAWVLAQAGVDVVAYDASPPQSVWHPVRVAGAETAERHADRALLLCWPPFATDVASRALAAYTGAIVIFAGEWRGGCAEPAFFDHLATDWTAIDAALLPNWVGRSDGLTVFGRRRTQPGVGRWTP